MRRTQFVFASLALFFLGGFEAITCGGAAPGDPSLDTSGGGDDEDSLQESGGSGGNQPGDSTPDTGGGTPTAPPINGGAATQPSLPGTGGPTPGGGSLGAVCNEIVGRLGPYSCTELDMIAEVNALTAEAEARSAECGLPDSYVAAAVLYCVGASCALAEGRPSEAASYEAEAVTNLSQRDQLCSCNPALPTVTCLADTYRGCPPCG